MKTSTARLIPMFALLLVSGVAASARGETKLSAEVFTASPQGFLVTSTLIAGDKEAVLVDGQFTLSDAHRLVGLILDSKKTLTTVYVTHAHPDHYFGLVVIKQAFPNVKMVAQPATVAEIKKTWAEKVKHWGPMYGANLPTKPLIPEPFTGRALTLEGQTIEIHGSVQGDDRTNSYVWIPSIKTVIAGDIVFQGIFPWTAETNARLARGVEQDARRARGARRHDGDRGAQGTGFKGRRRRPHDDQGVPEGLRRGGRGVELRQPAPGQDEGEVSQARYGHRVADRSGSSVRGPAGRPVKELAVGRRPG